MSNDNKKNITLVPTDFSECANAAIRHACDIASVIDEEQEVTLLYVIEGRETNELYSEDNPPPEDGTPESIMLEGARSKLRESVQKYKETFDLPINYLISSGKPYEVIAKTAEKIHSESIIMGTRGARGFGNIIGSNAAKVVQLAPCPVIVINEKARAKDYDNIVIPVDFESESRQTVKYAAQLAKYFNSVVHIVSTLENDRFLNQKVKNNIHSVEQYLKEHKVKYTTEVLTDQDDFVRATLNFAESRDADLILIMTQEQDIGDIIFGSYAQRIVNKSTIPVMCIHPRQDYLKSFNISSPGYGI